MYFGVTVRKNNSMEQQLECPTAAALIGRTATGKLDADTGRMVSDLLSYIETASPTDDVTVTFWHVSESTDA